LIGTVASVAIAVGSVVLERLNAALSAMHRADDLSSAYGSIGSPSALWSASPVQEHFQAWRDWDADRLASGLASRVAGPYWVLVAYAAVDTVLIAGPLTLLLWRLAGWTIQRVRLRRAGDPLADLGR
jgi:hypothetical protein